MSNKPNIQARMKEINGLLDEVNSGMSYMGWTLDDLVSVYAELYAAYETLDVLVEVAGLAAYTGTNISPATIIKTIGEEYDYSG